MFVIFCFIVAMNVTNLMSYQVISFSFNSQTNSTITTESCEQTKAVSLATDFIAILMRLYIPLIIMLILNCLIIKKLYETKKKVKNSTGKVLIQVTTSSKNLISNSQTTFSNKEFRFIKATITMDIIFWIFYTPVSINLTLNIINTFTMIFNTPISMVNYRFYSNISQLIAFTYHSVAIFMYFAFNQYFRAEFISLFRLNTIMPSWISRPANDSKQGKSINSVHFSLN